MGILGSLCLINIDDPTKPLSKTVVADGFTCDILARMIYVRRVNKWTPTKFTAQCTS